MSAAVITGAAGALGAAISVRLAREFDQLLLVDVEGDRLHRAVVDLNESLGPQGPEIAALGVDLARADCGEIVAAEIAVRGWSVGTLVNNAGINRDARATKLTDADFRAVISVDLLAPWRLAEALHAQMAPAAAVVNIASRAALGQFGQANYSAAKSGLVALTRALALAWAPEIAVNAVAPGLVDTPMTAGMPADVLAKLVSRVPARRMGEPREIADAVAFLAGSGARYVTGQTLFVCGGRSLAP